MAPYQITVLRAGHPDISGTLAESPLIIGRSPEADIVLMEDSISRMHARLYLRNGVAHVEDLDSSNGVFVNGQRVRGSVITGADSIRIGNYTIRIVPEVDEAITAADYQTELEYKDVGPLHARLVNKDHSSLSFLYRLSQHMGPHRALTPLLEAILSEVMEEFPSDRGFILMQESPDVSTPICVSQSRHENGGAEPPLSTTLVTHVRTTRVSVLTFDACKDARFEASDSIVAHEIKAAICVPLTARDSVFGVIYVDTGVSPVPFTQRHLQLLSIVGQVAGAAVENILLTERQIHQERLAIIGQTVSATSHDMRNILLGISGGTELLESACKKKNFDGAEKATRIIRISLRRFEELVGSLLTCAKKTDLRLEETQVGPLLDEVIATLGPVAERYGVKIAVKNNIARAISMDARQIHRVLTNLIKNALDAMENDGGTLHIETLSENGADIVRISDTGPGIPPENLPRIGQAFFTTKRERGTGLGLAVSYQIMAQHHGKIEVESVPGSGATFSLVFPGLARATARMKRITA